MLDLTPNSVSKADQLTRQHIESRPKDLSPEYRSCCSRREHFCISGSVYVHYGIGATRGACGTFLPSDAAEPACLRRQRKHRRLEPLLHSNTPLPPKKASQRPWLDQWLAGDQNETRKIILTAVVTVLGTLFVVFFKNIIGAANSAAIWLWKRLRVEKAIEGNYRKKLARELRSIQLFNMPEAKNLETLYIPLRLAAWLEPDQREKPPTSAGQGVIPS